MRLHRSDAKADWNKVRPSRRNNWQRLAEISHGVVTPGNIISIIGLILVIWGSYLLVRHDYLLGLGAIFFGRLADVFDGLVAESTHTKGPLGEFMDATIDKLALLVLLLALITQHVVPAAVLAIVIVQSGINVIVSAIAKAKTINLRPSAHGKIATAAVWMCLFFFAVLKASDLGGLHSLHALLAIIAYGLAVVYTYFGFRSSREYTKIVLDSLRYSPDLDLIHKLSRVIIVVNPQSSNVQRIEKRGQELHKLFPDKTIALVETTAQASELGAKLKREIMRQPGQTLICIGGGDGTVNSVVNSLMRLSTSIDISETPILPLWGGNANDFAYMLNGLSSRSTMRSLLGRGRTVAIYPFEITTRSGQQSNALRYAACYASFGASAYAASELEKPAAREEKISGKSALVTIVREMVRVARAIIDAPGFDAEQDGKRIKIFEQVFSNGSRMAKVDHLPVKLHEKKFYRAVKSQQQPPLWFYLLWLFRGGHYGEVTSKVFSFTTKERAWAQFDGEATVLPKNTTVTIGHAKTPFYAVSTKLASGDLTPRHPLKRWLKRVFLG